MTEKKKKVQIPVKVNQPGDDALKDSRPLDAGTQPDSRSDEGKPRAAGERASERERLEGQAARRETSGEDVDWRDLALRLQAEMENFRKRQRRLAQDEVASERERLLREILSVADNLERALASGGPDDGLRQGVEVTYNALLQWLGQQGVERLQSKGQRFDPAWHEAVSTIPREGYGVEPQTVVEVVEEGYTLNGRLLRPAKVVVAV